MYMSRKEVMDKLEWDDALRQDLMRWLLEFGDGWVTAKQRAKNARYQSNRRMNAASQTPGAEHSDLSCPQIFESDSLVKVSLASVRLNQAALDFLRGDHD